MITGLTHFSHITNTFDVFKKRGFFKANKEQMETSTPIYQRERKALEHDDKLVICGLCNGFYSKKCFQRHKNRCQGDSHSEACSVSLSMMITTGDDILNEFRREILCKFRNRAIPSKRVLDPNHFGIKFMAELLT